MGSKTDISWSNATWNPWQGCHKISAGCKNCYMYSDKARYGQDPNMVVRSKTTFNAPLNWQEGRLVFTCSWSDFFIEEADAWRDEAYSVMRRTERHTYQVLTKRIDRVEGRLPDPILNNMWLGTSVENVKEKWRINVLRSLPAVVRFLSIEPLLEDIGTLDLRGISWAIIGGESGSNARPMDINWARNIVTQCKAAGIACFVKQLGAFPVEYREVGSSKGGCHVPLKLVERKGR